MRRDGIAESDVEACIKEADEVLPSIEGRTSYLKYVDALLLRVTAIEEGGDFVIITVTLRRRRR
jgi:hypothetical protein